MSIATVAAPVAETRPGLDQESRSWLADLRSSGTVQDAAVERLHALLLRAAHFEVARRRPMLPNLRGNELDDIALEAADDALMSVLGRLDDFRGESRFTTWAYPRLPRGLREPQGLRRRRPSPLTR
jgi:RNA polymerase sigma-70 factor (ECF subfamily)